MPVTATAASNGIHGVIIAPFDYIIKHPLLKPFAGFLRPPHLSAKIFVQEADQAKFSVAVFGKSFYDFNTNKTPFNLEGCFVIVK